LFDAKTIFWNLTGGLVQPIFNQGVNNQRLKIAKANQEEYLAAFKQTLLNAGKEVANAMHEYQTASDKMTLRSNQIEFLGKSVDYTMDLLKYTSNTNYTDVLTSEERLLSAQLGNINDKLQQLQALVELYRSLGGGWK
jgi:outer membrane protein TolC